jgi:hypothetical protein
VSTTFKVARLSGIALVWTIGFGAAFLYFALGIALSISSGTPIILFDIVGSVLLLSLLIYAWLRATRRYEIDGENVTVIRHGPGRIIIPIAKIASAIYKPNIGNFFNLGFFGLGGLFGWAGLARVRNPTDIESLQAEVYGTNAKYPVVIEMESGTTIILTPADPQTFLAALEERGVRPPAPAAISRGRKQRRR